MENLVVVAVLFAESVGSNKARTALKRMGAVPIRHGGRREDGWIQYFLVEPTTAKTRTEIYFTPTMRLIMGQHKN